jgi:hypothetical protein
MSAMTLMGNIETELTAELTAATVKAHEATFSSKKSGSQPSLLGENRRTIVSHSVKAPSVKRSVAGSKRSHKSMPSASDKLDANILRGAAAASSKDCTASTPVAASGTARTAVSSYRSACDALTTTGSARGARTTTGSARGAPTIYDSVYSSDDDSSTRGSETVMSKRGAMPTPRSAGKVAVAIATKRASKSTSGDDFRPIEMMLVDAGGKQVHYKMGTLPEDKNTIESLRRIIEEKEELIKEQHQAIQGMVSKEADFATTMRDLTSELHHAALGRYLELTEV